MVEIELPFDQVRKAFAHELPVTYHFEESTPDGFCWVDEGLLPCEPVPIVQNILDTNAEFLFREPAPYCGDLCSVYLTEIGACTQIVVESAPQLNGASYRYYVRVIQWCYALRDKLHQRHFTAHADGKASAKQATFLQTAYTGNVPKRAATRRRWLEQYTRAKPLLGEGKNREYIADLLGIRSLHTLSDILEWGAWNEEQQQRHM